ncbi:MAG: hypothetical protein AAF624_10715 [Bacteroidota bacterium]
MEGLTWLERLGRRVPLYIQIKRGWLSVTDLPRDNTFETLTRVAYVPRAKRFEPRPITDAELASLRREWGDRLQVGDGFSHPRLPIGNFESAEHAFRYAIRQVLPHRRGRPGRLVVHVQEAWEGGLTDVELRAFRDMSINAGAITLGFLLEPMTLSNQDVLALLNGTYSGPVLLQK